ncbi:MotE family protein [Mariprofundus sp. EBB-1]|uniref:MotE family protein n=1 Tax=Mariprofundus sp. EBB-1 TaxID=2650971 RepID=UPI001F1C9B2D|nr:hypothetical protein [Mariprofundus sp. EBB-1]
MRKLSITMFAIIGLLFGSKIGLHIWQISSESGNTQTPSTQSIVVNEISLPELPKKPVITQPNAIHSMTAADSLALIESYLIPSANAEVSSQSTHKSIIEDKTLSSLRQLKDGLDQRADTLDQREQHLQQAEEKLKRRITELEQLEASIQQRLSDESKIKSKKMKRLTAVYEGMKPDRAAAVISGMELVTVVKIFLLMDEKKVGKILSFLPPEKAVVISQALTRRISSVK